QTTASIAHFLRNNREANLEDVAVQMKLVTVTDSDSSSVVQSVAKYANSQNRVSTADLFSTHDFHIRMEQISRRLKAPALEGKQYRSSWYYERARGQWENDRSALSTPAQKAQFDLEYPKNQRLTKTDFAKYNYCWNQHPDIVSKGAQSVFAEFATEIDNRWSRNDGKGADEFGDEFFRINVSLAMVYEALRVEVLKQEWYQLSRGYLANIVAYAIAKFSLLITQQFPDAELDFTSIWKNQKVGLASLAALTEIAHRSQLHLTNQSRPQANVTQWAKQQACWENFKGVKIDLSDGLRVDLISKQDAQSKASDARKERAFDTGFENIARILSVDSTLWEIAIAPSSGLRISPTESSLIRKFGLSQGAIPSERQSLSLLRVLNRMVAQGLIPDGSY
ncbi:AIPR family protein, partial [Streptomyces diacarni]|uniref:AIPR family protein n=1 Tax=Streptomyces diacarni TaxID=2800381 RepID=UPI0034081218